MHNHLVRALPWIARTVAQQCGVEVRFDPRAATASIARTGVITLPAVPAGDEESASLALGYVVHEGSHARHSDFEALDQLRAGPEIDFLGIFEDVRIERKAMTEFPGARSYLTRMWEILYEHGRTVRPTGEQQSPVLDTFAFALAHCRFQCLGLAVAEQDLAVGRAVLVERFGEDAVLALAQVLNGVNGCLSTWHALDLARKTIGWIHQVTGERVSEELPPSGPSDHQQSRQQQGQQPQQQPMQPQPQTAAGEPEQGSKKDASERSDAQSDTAAGGDAPAQQQAHSAVDATDAEASEGAGAGDNDGDAGHAAQDAASASTSNDDASAQPGAIGAVPETADANATTPQGGADVEGAGGDDGDDGDGCSWASDDKFVEMLQTELAGVVGDIGEDVRQALKEAIAVAFKRAVNSGDKPAMLGAATIVEPLACEISEARAPELLASAAAATTALRATIRHLLVSLTNEDIRFARRGRVKPTRLWRLRAGGMNVFEQTQDALEFDTAVTVLLDVSTSMKGATLALARRAVAAISLAIDGQAGVQTSVCAFPGEAAHEVTRLKRFDESAQRASARIAGVCAKGSTPMAEALYAVGPDLAEQSAQGRLLIVITDGQPDSLEHARIALGDLQAEGIDVIAVGIKTDVSSLFDKCVEIQNTDELASKMFEMLSERFTTYAAAA